MKLADDFYRPDGALLAGVCAELARRLGWNVWAIRALFLAGLLIQTLATGVIYVVAALVMGLWLQGRGAKDEPPGGLASERLGARGRRIQELEDKFRELERNGH